MATVLAVLALIVVFFTAPRADAATEVNLGTAGQFAVLAGAGVTNTGSTTIQTQDASIRGDVGTHPTDTITGDASISWIPPATGSLHKADAVAQNAQADNLIAYNTAAGAASDAALGGQLNGIEMLAGVHTASSALNLATNGTVTFNAENDPDATFIIQVGSSLTMESNSTVSLINGAQACHIFWQVSEDATIGTDATFVGTLLAENAIVAQSGASFEGRLLAQNAAVTLDNNTFTMPGCSPPVVDTDTDADGGTADADTDGGTTDADTDGGTDADADTDGGQTDADGGTADADSDGGQADADAGTADADSDGGTSDADAETNGPPLPDTGGPWLGLLPIALAAVMIGATAISSSKRRVRGIHRAG
ncbi:ice-binding family protein [Aeromicrobium sp.]|uniref:ice-binding family protein n=1 Tax=Aeromicrobium sp. TaxID=1871063 RepID=UPI002FC6CDF9